MYFWVNFFKRMLEQKNGGKYWITLLLIIQVVSIFPSFAQETFTHVDSLRGSNTPQRSWWDVQSYDLHALVQPSDSTIIGSNTITYNVLQPNKEMQIDLQYPMHIDKVVQDGKSLMVRSDSNAHFVQLVAPQNLNETKTITIFFSGHPTLAKQPPWDGGIVWTYDSLGNPWVANANQAIGASVWWPLKDYSGDEPNNGITISITAPDSLMDVSNGRLIKTIQHKTTKTWIWKVENPINTYGVNLSIGDYAHWRDTFHGEKGELSMDFYALKYHESRAKKQFQQAKKMLKAFEYWFGPYPFYEDGYKLVEVPYLGMEHQSCVTYGNRFLNGYLGRDLSSTGWGLKFDFIIIHESGHEWFANNITTKDVADLWVHEGFTCYSESLFLEYYYGKKAASDYVIGLRKLIKNKEPLIGHYGVNDEPTEDIYWKGANILNTLRYWINDDAKWRTILRGLNKQFYHQIVTTHQIEKYIAEKSGLDLKAFWNQYLRTTMVPQFEFHTDGATLRFRYQNCIKGFNMPLDLVVNGQNMRIFPTQEWKTMKLSNQIKTCSVNPNFYVNTLQE